MSWNKGCLGFRDQSPPKCHGTRFAGALLGYSWVWEVWDCTTAAHSGWRPHPPETWAWLLLLWTQRVSHCSCFMFLALDPPMVAIISHSWVLWLGLSFKWGGEFEYLTLLALQWYASLFSHRDVWNWSFSMHLFVKMDSQCAVKKRQMYPPHSKFRPRRKSEIAFPKVLFRKHKIQGR